MNYSVHHGDCLAIMPTLAANSVDAIVTDPPYGLAFMGKDWDHGVPGEHFWREALRVAKPGAHLLAFGGSRTVHRLAVAIEDAGWEIRDTIMWLYGSGFPKSKDASKAIDKAAGVEREITGPSVHHSPGRTKAMGTNGIYGGPAIGLVGDGKMLSAPATPDAERWAGWGTALKPAHEPIIVARKPLEGTVAANVLAWGTGAINVDGCRVGTDERGRLEAGYVRRGRTDEEVFSTGYGRPKDTNGTVTGRWPANVVHDGSEEVLRLFPAGTGAAGAKDDRGRHHGVFDGRPGVRRDTWGAPRDEKGSAARFYYCAKASKADRNEGLEGFELRDAYKMSGGVCIAEGRTAAKGKAISRNHHPTVKPTALMRWLVRLVTPPGGLVLDPFAGSGSTGKAAMLENLRFIGIEQDAEYCEIAKARIGYAVADYAFGLLDLPEAAD